MPLLPMSKENTFIVHQKWAPLRRHTFTAYIKVKQRHLLVSFACFHMTTARKTSSFHPHLLHSFTMAASPTLFAFFSILLFFSSITFTRASVVRQSSSSSDSDESVSGYNIIGQLLPDKLDLNLQEMSNLAMNPVELSNQTLMQLYQQSADIINGTDGADSVLLELDPVDNDNVNGSSQPKILVMAVYNPHAPSHDDLLDRFSLYFVNMTDSMPPGSSITTTSALKTPQFEAEKTEQDVKGRTSPLAILQNFAKNQVNALLGAFWMPFNVGAQTMEKLRLEHAHYVAAGSTFGSALSKPVIMQAISIPNNVASRIINVTGFQVETIESAEAASKAAAAGAIDSAVSGVQTGGRLAVQYAARPLGAFVGGNVNLAGSAVSRIGHGLDQAALQLNLIGDRIGESAQSAVSGGSWALAWAMDEQVLLPSELAAMEAAAAKSSH